MAISVQGPQIDPLTAQLPMCCLFPRPEKVRFVWLLAPKCYLDFPGDLKMHGRYELTTALSHPFFLTVVGGSSPSCCGAIFLLWSSDVFHLSKSWLISHHSLCNSSCVVPVKESVFCCARRIWLSLAEGSGGIQSHVFFFFYWRGQILFPFTTAFNFLHLSYKERAFSGWDIIAEEVLVHCEYRCYGLAGCQLTLGQGGWYQEGDLKGNSLKCFRSHTASTLGNCTKSYKEWKNTALLFAYKRLQHFIIFC